MLHQCYGLVHLQLISAPIVPTELLLANATDTPRQLNGTDADATDQNTPMDLLLIWNHSNLAKILIPKPGFS